MLISVTCMPAATVLNASISSLVGKSIVFSEESSVVFDSNRIWSDGDLCMVKQKQNVQEYCFGQIFKGPFVQRCKIHLNHQVPEGAPGYIILVSSDEKDYILVSLDVTGIHRLFNATMYYAVTILDASHHYKVTMVPASQLGRLRASLNH